MPSPAPEHPLEFPYFEALLNRLEKRRRGRHQAFGAHVHWGYWPDPGTADGSQRDIELAAEALCAQVCADANLADGQDILDVGCGLGGTLAYITRIHGGTRLVGLNIDHRQLAYARRVELPAHHKIQWIQGDACHLPFPDASFDRLLAVECIFHFASRRDFLREAMRVLRPGGSLAWSDFVPEAALVPLTRLIAKSRDSMGFFGPCDFTCTEEQYHTLLRESGWVATRQRDITIHTLPTYDFLKGLNPVVGAATAFIESMSRSGRLRYLIFSARKGE